MRKNVASQVIGAEIIAVADGTPLTTGTVTIYVTGDNGAQAAGSVGSGACAHKGRGYWSYAPAQAETNYDHIAFTFEHSGGVNVTVQVFPTFPQTGDNFARLGAPAGASVSADIAAVKVDSAAVKVKTDFLPSATAGAAGGVFIAGANAATSITTALTANIIGNITGNLSGSVGSVTGAVGSVTGAVGSVAAGGITAASFAANAINAAKLDPDVTTELQAGLATAAALATVDSIVDDILLDTAEIGAAGAGLTNINLPNQTMDIVGNITGNLSGSVGSVTGAVGSVAAGGIVAATFAANALDAVWSTAVRLLTAGTNIVLAKGVGVTGFNDLDAAGIRTAVGLASNNLDTQLAQIPSLVWSYSLLGSPSPLPGTAGAYLLSASAAGDPWGTPLPGAYGAGTAGFILGTNLDATITSRLASSSNGAGLSAIPWNAAWDVEVQSEAADALNAYDPPTNAEMVARTLLAADYATAAALDAVDNLVDTEVGAIKAVTDKVDTALVLDGAVYQFTANALELAPSGGGSLTAGQVWEYLLSGSPSPASGSAGEVLLAAGSGGSAPSAAVIADAVWDETRAGHVAGGSFGEGVASVQGNVTGSAASITGAVASVTGNVGGNVVGSVASVSGAVGSVTGNVGGNVVGSVASVTAGVTVTTNNDKTGYALSTAGYASVADKILGRHIAGGSDVSGSEARNVTSALRALRNRQAIPAGIGTVYEEDDTTASWTYVATTTAGNPLSEINPT